jgi:predicted glycosyltransferase
MLTFMGNADQEQEIRARALESRGILNVLTLSDLEPQCFTDRILTVLKSQVMPATINLDGVTNTRLILNQFVRNAAIEKNLNASELLTY